MKDKEKKMLIRCPECKRENYAFNVASGICTWCYFDINAKEEEEEKEDKK
tara:strand:- start:2745 stop:2894 length:150 start_codon:yes stop_codon:yes gene_type:complete